MFPDALPEPFPHLPIESDERGPNIAPGVTLGHQSESRLAGLTLDAEQIVFVDRESLRLQPGGRWALRYLLSLRLDTIPSSPASSTNAKMAFASLGSAWLNWIRPPAGIMACRISRRSSRGMSRRSWPLRYKRSKATK